MGRQCFQPEGRNSSADERREIPTDAYRNAKEGRNTFFGVLSSRTSKQNQSGVRARAGCGSSSLPLINHPTNTEEGILGPTLK